MPPELEARLNRLAAETGREAGQVALDLLTTAVADQAPALSPEEDAGLEAALDSFRQGRTLDAQRARGVVDAALGR